MAEQYVGIPISEHGSFITSSEIMHCSHSPQPAHISPVSIASAISPISGFFSFHARYDPHVIHHFVKCSGRVDDANYVPRMYVAAADAHVRITDSDIHDRATVVHFFAILAAHTIGR